MNRRLFLKAAGCSTISAGIFPAAPTTRPNILIITTDQQSADAMSCRMGGRYLKTPAMDSLAASGTLFSRAYCANPLCIPSRTSMYSGRYPSETGIQTNDKITIDPLKFPCMGAIFQRAGYETAYAGKWHTAFDPKDERQGFRFLTPKKAPGPDAGATAASIEFLKTKRSKPFLLVTSLLNPHNICEWPRGQALPCGAIGDPPPLEQCPPRRANYAPQKNEPAIVARMRRSYQATPMFPVGNFDEAKWRQFLWAYYRMIEMVDGLIGQLLQALRTAGLEENTLVVLLSDHGDCQGAHGWNQKTILFEEAARVPCILSHKGVTTQSVSNRLVHTGIDLLPTVCDFAGIPAPAGLPGLSLKDTAIGKTVKDPRDYIVVTNRMVQGADENLHPDGRMVRGQRYKYFVLGDGERRESLVDLEKDPGEMTNLAEDPAHKAMLNRYRTILAEWCSKVGDKFPTVKPA